jgi:hypothetical protein
VKRFATSVGRLSGRANCMTELGDVTVGGIRGGGDWGWCRHMDISANKTVYNTQLQSVATIQIQWNRAEYEM